LAWLFPHHDTLGLTWDAFGRRRISWCPWGGFAATFCGKETMNPHTVLWIYIVLLVIGGLIGFLKAKSQVSLIMSVAFAAALSLCAAGIIFQPYVADLLLAALLVVFAMRLTKTKKFMPAGLMLVITIVVLALRHIRF
jgi:uncharacterized membrane protein (UPF0136 family)